MLLAAERKVIGLTTYTCSYFLLLARYVPNVAKRISVRRSIDDRPTDRPTNLTFGKISNGDISAADRPIYSVFGSRMGLSGSANRMALIPV